VSEQRLVDRIRKAARYVSPFSSGVDLRKAEDCDHDWFETMLAGGWICRRCAQWDKERPASWQR
jgi:hypothetical protein